MLTGLDDVLGCVERMEQNSSHAVPHTFGTTDTSGDEIDESELRGGVRSKWIYQMKKVLGADELSRFFVTGTMLPGYPFFFTAACAGIMRLS